MTDTTTLSKGIFAIDPRNDATLLFRSAAGLKVRYHRARSESGKTVYILLDHTEFHSSIKSRLAQQNIDLVANGHADPIIVEIAGQWRVELMLDDTKALVLDAHKSALTKSQKSRNAFRPLGHNDGTN